MASARVNWVIGCWFWGGFVGLGALWDLRWGGVGLWDFMGLRARCWGWMFIMLEGRGACQGVARDLAHMV